MLEVEISRYCPGEDVEPYLQKFSLPLDKGTTVLGVLGYIQTNLDESLAFKAFCTNQHCGECGVRVNGQPVLACEAIITTDYTALKPLAKFLVVKDLVVDVDSMIKRLWASLPSLTGKLRDNDFLTENERQTFFMAGGCTGCSICQSVCPLFKADQDVIAGPGFYMAISQYLLRYNSRENFVAFLKKAVEHKLLECTACGNCSKFCPKGLNPRNVLAIIINLIIKYTDIPVEDQKLQDLTGQIIK